MASSSACGKIASTCLNCLASLRGTEKSVTRRKPVVQRTGMTRSMIKSITIIFFLLSPYGSPAAPLEHKWNEAPGALHVFNVWLADSLAERLLLNAYPVHMAN